MAPKGTGAKNKNTKQIKHDKANKNSSAEKFSSIQVALQEAELPDAVRQLLRCTLPGAFNVDGARHKFQERMCQMIGQALSTVREKRRREFDKCKRQLCQENAEFQEGENSRDQAQLALDKSREVTDRESLAVNAAGSIVADAKRKIQKAEADLRQCQAEIVNASMVRHASGELRACVASVPEQISHLENDLTAPLQQQQNHQEDLEQSKELGQTREELKELKVLLETPDDDLDARILSLTKANVEFLQTLWHARAELMDAEDKHQACEVALKNAREARGQCDKELKAAEKVLRQKGKRIQDAEAEVEDAQTELTAFQNKPLEDYAAVCKKLDMPLPTELQEPAAPPAEPPAPPAEPAAPPAEPPAPPQEEKKTLQINVPQAAPLREQQIRRRRNSWLPRHVFAAKKQRLDAMKQAQFAENEPAAENQDSTEEQLVQSSPAQQPEAASQEEVSVVMPVAEEVSTEMPAANEAAVEPMAEEATEMPAAAGEVTVKPTSDEVSTEMLAEKEATEETGEEVDMPAAAEVSAEMPLGEEAAAEPTSESSEVLVIEAEEEAMEPLKEDIPEEVAIKAEEEAMEPLKEDIPEEVAMEAEEVAMETEVVAEDAPPTEAAGAPMINSNRRSAVMRRRSAWLPDGMFTMFGGRESTTRSTEATDLANDPKASSSKVESATDFTDLPTPHRSSMGAASDASHESIE